MSEPARPKSHAITWTVLLLLVLPLLYLLSAPVLVLYGNPPTRYPQEMEFVLVPDPAHIRFAMVQSWVARYYLPYGWLMEHTPLKKTLEAYALWWMQGVAVFPGVHDGDIAGP